MTNTTAPRSVRPAVGIGAVAVAIASIVGAGVVNVGAESVPKPAPTTLDARQIAELQAIADWAREQGLTGLSPASLYPAGQSSRARDDAAIADWARDHCLTGLSPASLHPTDAC